MNGRCGGCTGCKFFVQFPGELDEERDVEKVLTGCPGQRREVMRLWNSDAARSGEREQQKEEGRGRAA